MKQEDWLTPSDLFPSEEQQRKPKTRAEFLEEVMSFRRQGQLMGKCN